MTECRKKNAFSVKDLDNACKRLSEMMQPSDVVLETEANTVVDTYITALKETMDNFNITLKEDEYKKLLLNIYSNLSSETISLTENAQKGGAFIRNQLMDGNDKSYTLTHFKAFAALLTSIMLLYLAYNILNGLTCRLTGETILQYPQEVFKDVFTTTQEMTFLQYVWNSVSTLSSNVVGQQTAYITRILQTSMHTIIPDMSAIVNETCMPQSMGLLGNTGRYLAGIMTPQTTSDCVVETSAELARQFLAAQEGKLALLAIQTKTTFAQVIMLTRLGVGMGAASIGYFATVLTTPKSNRFEAIDEEGRTYLEGGGRRRRNTRKRNNKRSRRTRRKSGPANWK
jgi:hypothetical protein